MTITALRRLNLHSLPSPPLLHARLPRYSALPSPLLQSFFFLPASAGLRGSSERQTVEIRSPPHLPVAGGGGA